MSARRKIGRGTNRHVLRKLSVVVNARRAAATLDAMANIGKPDHDPDGRVISWRGLREFARQWKTVGGLFKQRFVEGVWDSVKGNRYSKREPWEPSNLPQM